MRMCKRNSGRGQIAVIAFLISIAWQSHVAHRVDAASLSVRDATLVEGNTGIRNASMIVSLAGPSSKTVRVNYSTKDGTAKSGTDYDAVAGKLNFAPGETSKSIQFPIRGDRVGEVNERFIVNLSSAQNAKITDGQGIVTIVDDEPRISIRDARAPEGNSGVTYITFEVSLSAPYDEDTTLSYATADSSAITADNDYVAVAGTLTFEPGETTKAIKVAVLGNDWVENSGYDEVFHVNLSGASRNALLIDNQGIGTIGEDDIPVQPADPGTDCTPDHPYYPNC